MNARFIHDGDAVDYTPTEDTPAGTIVIQGDLVGVAKVDIPANTLGALAVTGVFAMAKESDAVLDAGTKVYGLTQDGTVTSDGGAQGVNYLGKTVEAAGDGTTSVRVRLEQ